LSNAFSLWQKTFSFHMHIQLDVCAIPNLGTRMHASVFLARGVQAIKACFSRFLPKLNYGQADIV
jgi:hypothetical protein